MDGEFERETGRGSGREREGAGERERKLWFSHAGFLSITIPLK